MGAIPSTHHTHDAHEDEEYSHIPGLDCSKMVLDLTPSALPARTPFTHSGVSRTPPVPLRPAQPASGNHFVQPAHGECVCVREREREREREKKNVCVRERERARERQGERNCMQLRRAKDALSLSVIFRKRAL